MHEPNIERLLKAFYHEEADRVPVLEPLIQRRNLEYLLGKRKIHSLFDQIFEEGIMDPAGFVLPIEQGLDPMDFSFVLPPKDALDLCYTTGMDAILPLLIWCVKPRPTGSLAGDQNPFINDWDEMHKMPPAPSAKIMVERIIDPYIEATRGTKIGVGPQVRSVLCNAYETLGLENFMIKLYDDIELVEHMMDIYMNYSIALTEELSKRDIDLLWLDDDIADSRGLMIGPKFTRELWLPRTKKILEPIKAKKIPIGWHCCGNLTDVVPLAIELGIDALQPFQTNCNDIKMIKEKYGDQICIIGGIDCVTLAFGEPEDVIRETKEALEYLAPGGGYVAGSSHSIQDDIPPENYMAMLETVFKYGNYGK